MRLVDCTFDRHAEDILAIFNDAIANSTALYEYLPRTMETMVTWFDAKAAGNYPVVGIESSADEGGELLGFASYGRFRPYAAFKYAVEHSVYVRGDHRGRGIGSMLMTTLIERATAQQFHLMIGGIDAENLGSIALHERFGFTHSGTIRQAGFKFGRWLDLSFYQKVLDTPDNPVDG